MTEPTLIARLPELRGLTENLVAHARRLAASPLPEEVRQTARHCVLDWLGIAIAGAHEPLVLKLLEEAREQGGAPLASAIGHGKCAAPGFTAMVNAAAADALDFSDGNLAMRGHTTPAVIAVALALAETRPVSGQQFIAAIVAGIETECRIGLLVNPPFLRKGFHPTGSMATFGAAACAAHLLGLDAGQWAMALGLAATQAAGLLASGGTMAKPFHSGKCAFNGLLAASLARRDFVGRPDAIEAPDGFLDTHASGWHAAALDFADGRHLIRGTIFKSHAACVLTHSTIENMLALSHDHAVAADDVARITLHVPRGFLSVCNIAAPRTGLEAKFSLRGVAAMALLGDDTRDIAAYSAARIQRPELCALRDRIAVVARDDLSGGTSIAIVELADGRSLTLTNDAYQPLPDLARQHELVTRKFRLLTRPVLGAARTEALEQAVLNLHDSASLQPIIAIAGQAGVRE